MSMHSVQNRPKVLQNVPLAAESTLREHLVSSCTKPRFVDSASRCFLSLCCLFDPAIVALIMNRALSNKRVAGLLLQQGRQLIAEPYEQSHSMLVSQTLPVLSAAFHVSAVSSAGFSPSLNTPVDPSFLMRRSPPTNYGIRCIPTCFCSSASRI